MSREVYELIREMDAEKIETHLVVQCAPMLSGIKISNLFIAERRLAAQVRRALRSSGISCLLLFDDGEKMTWFLYRERELSAYLAQGDVRGLMRRMGYESRETPEILEQFRARYAAYRRGEENFPHEMGLLLGYPVEDVEGFIANGGKNCLYSGYWKVYGNVEEKIALFARYEEARKRLLLYLAKKGGKNHG